MKIASAIVLGIVLAVFSLWFFFVRAPAPPQVCDHILDVTLREAGQQGMAPETQADIVERMREQCIQHKLDKIQLRGRIKYAGYAKCVMSSETLADIAGC